MAILNPSELRYSGGTRPDPDTDHRRRGPIEFGEAVDTETTPALLRPRYWRKVKGNAFHNGRTRLVNATFPPSWPVAGEELLNAWRSVRGRNMSGLFASTSSPSPGSRRSPVRWTSPATARSTATTS